MTVGVEHALMLEALRDKILQVRWASGGGLRSLLLSQLAGT
jgi:hypothetical protein